MTYELRMGEALALDKRRTRGAWLVFLLGRGRMGRLERGCLGRLGGRVGLET